MIERAWSKLDFLLHVIVLCPPTNHRSDLRSDLGLMTENFCSARFGHLSRPFLVRNRYTGRTTCCFLLFAFCIAPGMRTVYEARRLLFFSFLFSFSRNTARKHRMTVHSKRTRQQRGMDNHMLKKGGITTSSLQPPSSWPSRRESPSQRSQPQ